MTKHMIHVPEKRPASPLEATAQGPGCWLPLLGADSRKPSLTGKRDPAGASLPLGKLRVLRDLGPGGWGAPWTLGEEEGAAGLVDGQGLEKQGGLPNTGEL